MIRKIGWVMKKILFVDDDALVARIYSEKLAEAGFEVVVAQDGVAAMKRVTEFKPDLVVLDLLMPKLTGADVLKYIREHPTLKSTRVVVFSNSYLAALLDQVGQTDAEYSLPKSATPALLIETIHKVLAGPEHIVKPSAKAAGAKPAPASVPAASVSKQPSQSRAAQDQQFRERVKREFVEHTPRMIVELRRVCREFLDAADSANELALIEDLTRKVGFLGQTAAMAGYQQLAQLSSALEALLFHLHEKESAVDDSCRNTIAKAVVLLAEHLDGADQAQMDNLPPAAILVVDDNPVSNRALVQTLVGANLPTTGITDPFDALASLQATPYDLVLLDIEMPGMDGLVLCEQIRALPLHKRTPVVFITSHADLRTRSRSILSGGNEFISKPVLPLELNVKVFAQLLKHRAD